jgi:hypothetical protein
MSEEYEAMISASKDHLADLGLPVVFLDNLLKDDDWSFVIKLHALIELAMTNACVVHVGEEGTRDIFARLEISNTRTGKLAFAKAMDFLESEDRRFVHTLSELRNTLVHDARNVGLQLAEHARAMTTKERREFVRDLCYADIDEESAAELDKGVEQFLRAPRRMIWRSGIFVVAVLFMKLQTLRLMREGTRHKLRFADLMQALQRGAD